MKGYSYHGLGFCFDCLRRYKQTEMVNMEAVVRRFKYDLASLEKSNADLKSLAIEEAIKVLKEATKDISDIYSSFDLRVDESMALPDLINSPEVCKDCGKQLGK